LAIEGVMVPILNPTNLNLGLHPKTTAITDLSSQHDQPKPKDNGRLWLRPCFGLRPMVGRLSFGLFDVLPGEMLSDSPAVL
jgi:hypothetical protein